MDTIEPKKQQWIEAYTKTLEDYKEYHHLFFACEKCKAAKNLFGVISKCGSCPENIFNIKEGNIYKNGNIPGCRLRKNEATQVMPFRIGDVDLEYKIKNLILYHEKAIDYLTNMDEFNLSVFQDYLFELDKDIHIKNYLK